MLLAAFIISLVIASLMTIAGISVINETPQRTTSGAVAGASTLLLIMLAPVNYAAWTEDGLALQAAAAWLALWSVFMVVRMILRIDRRGKEVGPRKGLLILALNLSFIAALVVVMAGAL